jgi:hypothetical protein
MSSSQPPQYLPVLDVFQWDTNPAGRDTQLMERAGRFPASSGTLSMRLHCPTRLDHWRTSSTPKDKSPTTGTPNSMERAGPVRDEFSELAMRLH